MVFDDFDNEGIQATNHVCLRAADDILHGVDEALWLRGLSELHVADPFDLKYDFVNSWGADRLDVSGCILGGDGSGGKFGKQIRTRKCGFGFTAFRLTKDRSFHRVRYALGSVPGTQTVPRSEITVLLHALRHTKGDALIECDNRSVFRTFSKGPSAKPIYNSCLWHVVFCAVKERADLGFGTLNIEWIKSHVKAEVALHQGECPYKWVANATADALANRAAELVQLFEHDLGAIKSRSE